jgi:hypothetical protein
MKVLVKKMEKLGLLKFVNIFYAIIMIGLALVIPVTIIIIDVTLMTNPTVIGLTLIGLLFYGVIGYLVFIRPFAVYRQLPEVMVETDGEFLYIHGKKEAKIPINEIDYAEVDTDIPYVFQPGFLREFIIHIFSSNYGTVILEIENFGRFKMPFVADAEEVSDELIGFIREKITDK